MSLFTIQSFVFVCPKDDAIAWDTVFAALPYGADLLNQRRASADGQEPYTHLWFHTAMMPADVCAVEDAGLDDPRLAGDRLHRSMYLTRRANIDALAAVMPEGSFDTLVSRVIMDSADTEVRSGIDHVDYVLTQNNLQRIT